MGRLYVMSGNMWVAAIVLMVLGWAFGPMAWRAFQTSDALLNGEERTATVLELVDTGSRHNDDVVVRMKLRVEATDHLPAYEAQVTSALSSVRLQAVAPGRALRVKVSRSHPERIALVDG